MIRFAIGHASSTLHTFITTLAMCGCLVTRTNAAVLNFTVDPLQSSIALDPVIQTPNGPVTLQPQQSGSLVASYTGTILADITGTTLNSMNGTLTAQAAPYHPLGSGHDANYGYELEILPLFFLEGFFGETSFSIAGEDGGQTVIAESFWNVYTGNLPAIFEVDLSGLININVAPAATVEIDGLLATLTLPFDVTFGANVVDAETTLHFTGEIVGTAIVPEASSFFLLGCAGIPSMFLFQRLRWNRR